MKHLDPLTGVARPSHSIVLGLLLLYLATFRADAEGYSIDWFKIAGGSGTSTDGVYFVSGTLGQPEAGTMSGGTFTLQGGFWPGIILPSDTGVPKLMIQWSGSKVILSWSPASPGFVLEETGSLASPSWSPAPTGNPTTILSVSGVVKFYRLRKP